MQHFQFADSNEPFGASESFSKTSSNNNFPLLNEIRVLNNSNATTNNAFLPSLSIDLDVDTHPTIRPGCIFGLPEDQALLESATTPRTALSEMIKKTAKENMLSLGSKQEPQERRIDPESPLDPMNPTAYFLSSDYLISNPLLGHNRLEKPNKATQTNDKATQTNDKVVPIKLTAEEKLAVLDISRYVLEGNAAGIQKVFGAFANRPEMIGHVVDGLNSEFERMGASGILHATRSTTSDQFGDYRTLTISGLTAKGSSTELNFTHTQSSHGGPGFFSVTATSGDRSHQLERKQVSPLSAVATLAELANRRQ